MDIDGVPFYLVRRAPMAPALNLASWRDDPFIRDNHSRAYMDDLDAELRALAQDPSSDMVTWGMRQITFERAG